MNYNYLPEDVIVGLDNGHGTRGYTKGKCSPDKTYYEGEWSRIMTPRIADGLRDIGFEPRIIVPENKDILLSERCARANKIMYDNPKKLMIFISLHTNAVGDKDPVAMKNGGWNDIATGMVVYVARKCSKMSEVLAKNLHDVAVEMGLKGNRSIPKEGFWRENWSVVHNTLMPAVLTESAFHTNHHDVEYLLSEKGQEDITNMHLIGICKTFGIPYVIKVGYR